MHVFFPVTAWLGNNWGEKSVTCKWFVQILSFSSCKNGNSLCWTLWNHILFSRQLFIQFGDIVVPLCLVTGSRYGGSQVVFLPECLDLELATAVCRTVSEDRLRARQVAWLLIDQPHIPVKTWGGSRQKFLNVALHYSWKTNYCFPHRNISWK